MTDYPERPEADFAINLTSPILAMTQCAVCPQVLPLSLAYTGKYFSDTEHFCSEHCREIYDNSFDGLPLLRGAGL